MAGDFDNNGKTDLLFNGYIDYYPTNALCSRVCLVILDMGKDSFQIKELTLSTIELLVAKTLMIDGRPYIQTLKIQDEYNAELKKNVLRKTVNTLAYVFNSFIERSTLHDYAIQQVKYCVDPAMIGFDGFTMTISADSIILMAGKSRIPECATDSGGRYAVKLDPRVQIRIFGILNYINFPDLKNEYTVNADDDLDGYIQVVYNNGEIKRIHDYGRIGTFGLKVLQDAFFELRKTQPWTRTGPGEPFVHCHN